LTILALFLPLYPAHVPFVLCLGFCDKRDPLSFENSRKFKRDKCCLIAHRNETKYGGRWVVVVGGGRWSVVGIFRAKVAGWAASFPSRRRKRGGTSSYKRKFSNNLISGNKQQKHPTTHLTLTRISLPNTHTHTVLMTS